MLSQISSFLKKHKKALANWLRVIVTVVGITLVASQINIQETLAALREANWLLMSAVLLYVQLGIFVRAARWQTLLQGLGLNPGFWRLTGLYYAGAFFNTFLPTGFGGDVVRVLEVGRDVKPADGLATVIIDRASGLFVLFVLALVALPFQFQLFPTELNALVVTISMVGIAGWFILIGTDLIPRVLANLPLLGMQKIIDVLVAIRKIGQKSIWQAVGYSLLFNLILISSYWLTARVFDVNLSITVFVVFTPLSAILLLLPSIQGWGVREPTNVLLLGSVGIAPEPAVAFSFGTYLLTLSNGVIGGLYYAYYTLANIAKRTEVDETDVPSTKVI